MKKKKTTGVNGTKYRKSCVIRKSGVSDAFEIIKGNGKKLQKHKWNRENSRWDTKKEKKTYSSESWDNSVWKNITTREYMENYWGNVLTWLWDACVTKNLFEYREKRDLFTYIYLGNRVIKIISSTSHFRSDSLASSERTACLCGVSCMFLHLVVSSLR